MNTVRGFVVTVMAEPYLETISFRLVPDRLAAAPYVMPFKPMPGVADKALGGVLLYDAFHLITPLPTVKAYLRSRLEYESQCLPLGNPARYYL